MIFVRKDKSTFPAEVSSSVFNDVYSDKKTSVIIQDVIEHKQHSRYLCLLPVPRNLFHERNHPCYLHKMSCIVLMTSEIKSGYKCRCYQFIIV